MKKPIDIKVNGAIDINPNNATYSAKSSFGLHPGASPLKELYDAGKLALVHVPDPSEADRDRMNTLLFERSNFNEQADFLVAGSVAQTISIEATALQQAATEIARSVVSLALDRF